MFAVLEEEDIGMREKNKMLQNKYIVLLLITGAVYFFLRFISPLLTPVIIAGMFLTFCYPAFDDIQKKTKIKKQYLAGVILFDLRRFDYFGMDGRLAAFAEYSHMGGGT